MFQSHYGFDHGSRTGSGEEMADHGFDGADGAPAGFGIHIFPKCSQALQFNGVPHRSAGAVAFHKVDIGGGQACVLIGLGHGPHLPLAVRCKEVAADIV